MSTRAVRLINVARCTRHPFTKITKISTVTSVLKCMLMWMVWMCVRVFVQDGIISFKYDTTMKVINFIRYISYITTLYTLSVKKKSPKVTKFLASD